MSRNLEMRVFVKDKPSAPDNSVKEVIFASIPMWKTFARNNPTSTYTITFIHHLEGRLGSMSGLVLINQRKFI